MSNSNKDACPRWISFGLRFHRSREGWYSFLPTNGSCRFLRSTLLQTKPKRKRSRDLNAATKATCELRRRLRFVSRDGIVAMGMQTMDVRLSIFLETYIVSSIILLRSYERSCVGISIHTDRKRSIDRSCISNRARSEDKDGCARIATRASERSRDVASACQTKRARERSTVPHGVPTAKTMLVFDPSLVLFHRKHALAKHETSATLFFLVPCQPSRPTSFLLIVRFA